MNRLYLDTESIGFYGPTVLVQYAIGRGDIRLHNIWDNPVYKTLDLIEQMTQCGVVGFNLTHDWFHINRTYGVLSCLPKMSKPSLRDYADCEDSAEAHDSFCVKPAKALDLLLHGRKGEFQSTLNQKDIRLRKVPRIMSEYLLTTLKSKIAIPSIYFNKSQHGYEWKVEYLHEDSNEAITPEEMAAGADIDPNFVNIVLRFAPSASLKSIWNSITGEDVTTYDEIAHLPKVEEEAWWPTSGKWLPVAEEYLYHWRNDPRALEYAKKDVVMTRGVDDHFGNPELGDVDSELACAIGAMYWRGYSYDKKKVLSRYKEVKKIVDTAPINVNSPKQVKEWIWASCSPLEKVAVRSTAAEILKKIADEWPKHNPEAARKAQLVVDVRRAKNELQLLERLLIAGRMYVSYKVIGTKSNRMSGGSESFIKSGGSINPQGIKKGDAIRPLFTLAPDGMILCGGDFDGFEVSIAEAVYNDPLLRAELLSGKKMHGLFGAEIYEMTYDEILATEKNNKEDKNGFYARAKTGFFASLYGAMAEKLSKALWLAVEKTEAGLNRFATKYSKIKETQEKDKENFAALHQSKLGGKIEWREPKEYVESFLGFRRYFTLEYKIMKCLYELATDPPDELKSIGRGIKVVRRDRLQTIAGATMSSLFGLAFSLQNKIFRAAMNHKIQSPGGQMTKELQGEIWTVQPSGVGKWLVMPMNIHDELEAPCDPSVISLVRDKVKAKIEKFRERVPLINMDWEMYKHSWSGGISKEEYMDLTDSIRDMVTLKEYKVNSVCDGWKEIDGKFIPIGKIKKYSKVGL